MDLRARIIISADDQSRAGFDSARNNINQLNQQISQIRTALLGVLGVSIGAGLIKDLVDTADKFKLLESTIKLSTRSQQEFANAEQGLIDISQDTKTQLEGNVNLYRRVSDALRTLGGDQQRSLNLIDLIAKSVRLGGTAAETAANGVEQFNQGLGSGVLRGEEFNSVMENTPRLAQALADGFKATKGELRDMAEQGKLTAEEVIKALESQSDVIDKEFSRIPATVGASLTQLNNAFTLFIGREDQAEGATTALANTISGLALNFNTVANAALLLAKIYVASLVVGIAKSTAAVIANAIATREATAAMQAQLQWDIRRAEVAVQNSLAMIQEAQLQRGLAQTDAQRALAIKALDAAYAKHAATVTLLNTKNAQLAELAGQNAAATGAMGKAMFGLNAAMSIFIGYQVGRALGEWLDKFDEWRISVSYLSETLSILQAGLEALADGGVSLGERIDQIKQIHAVFEQIRGQEVASAENVRNAEKLLADETVNNSTTIQAAWNKVSETLKTLNTLTDEQYTRQNDSLKRKLDERLAAIDAGAAQELEKQDQRAQAIALAAQSEFNLAKTTAEKKLLLLTQTYEKQIQKLGDHNTRAEILDRESIEKRKAIYTELAQRYAAVVDRLAQEHSREVEAARAAGESLQQLALQHQFDLANAERIGLNEYRKIQSEKAEFAQNVADIEAELAKGKAADQDKINGLIERSKGLIGEIGSAEQALANENGGASSARGDSVEMINRLYELQKTSIEGVQKAHEDNAKTLEAEQQKAIQKLEETNQKIEQIAENLAQDYALKIGVNTQEIDAAIDKINSIPTDKYVTIHTTTVNDGSTQSAPADVARQTGGPAAQRFSDGGYPRRQGRLPGFGGGDKVRAMLELGEWIINKNAVADYGDPTMAAINQGKLPIKLVGGQWVLRNSAGDVIFPAALANTANAQDPIRRAAGGAVSKVGRNYQEWLREKLRRLQLSEGALTAQVQMVRDPSFADNSSSSGFGSFPGGEGIQTFASALKIGRNVEQALQEKLNLLAQSASASLKEKSTNFSLPKISIPAPSFPNFNLPETASPARSAASGEMITVQFRGPSNASVSGQFKRDDAEGLLRILGEAAAVTK